MIMKRSNWKMREQSQLVMRLGELLDHGYPLSEAMQFLKLQANKKQKVDIDHVMASLRSGLPLYVTLKNMNFHPQLVSFIYFSEQYGNLPKALLEGGRYWEKRSEDMEKIKKLLVYPFFLLFFVLNVFYLMQKILLPKFEVLFQSLEAKQNIFLELVITLGALFSKIPWLILGGALGYYLFQILYFKKLSPLKRRRIALKIPISGPFLKLYETHFFVSQLSGLLSGGLSINESITLFSKSEEQPFYHELCLLIKKELTEGKPLEGIFKSLPYFEKNLNFIAANGQKSGRLDQELFHYSRYLLERIEERMKLALKIIQPTLFTVIGLMIISIYLAVLLPMFSLMKEI